MKMVNIVHEETGQTHKVPESAFLKVWSSRGYRLVEDVKREAEAKRAAAEDGGGEQAPAEATPLAGETLQLDSPQPGDPGLGETATGDSKQKTKP